jgi:signal transduction histidine kinase
MERRAVPMPSRRRAGSYISRGRIAELVGHELRTSLTIALGDTRALRGPRPLSTNLLSDLVRDLDDASRRLRRTAENIVHLVELDDGAVVPESVVVAEAVGEALLIHHVSCPGAAPEVVGTSRQLCVDAVPHWVTFVLTTVLATAWEHRNTEQQARVDWWAEPDRGRISVSTTGELVPAATLMPGYELSLRVARCLARSMGGELAIYTAQPPATVFDIVLPRAGGRLRA